MVTASKFNARSIIRVAVKIKPTATSSGGHPDRSQFAISPDLENRPMAVFECEQCGFSKSAPDEWQGKRAICPKCKNTAIIKPDELVLADDDFDESLTFAYKGDFLGMHEHEFLKRHDDPSSTEFRIVSSQDCPTGSYDEYGFEDWMKSCPNIVQYSVTGSRMTIVGFQLRFGIFTFLDRKLSTISLALADPSERTYIEILPKLYAALDDESDDYTASSFHITTWKRSNGNMSLVFSAELQNLDIRYVNQLLLPAFNRLQTKMTGSDDL